MHPQLEELEREFAGTLPRIRALVASASAEEWSARPPAGGWSAAECVAHLNLTAQATLPGIDGALAEARERGGGIPTRLRRDPVGWLIWKSSGPDGRMKVKTKPGFVPTARRHRDELVAEFESLQREQIARVRTADGLPIHRVKMRSPFDPRASYSVFSALSILAVHQHRHLAQAERAVEAVRGSPVI